jgi:hypothetical protein
VKLFVPLKCQLINFVTAEYGKGIKINLHEQFPLLSSFQTNINYFRTDRIAWGTVSSRERDKNMLL